MISATTVDNRALGYLAIEVTPPSGEPIEITIVRGIPTQIGDFSISDPFGDNQLSFVLPAVTIYDKPGNGDISWLRPFSKVEMFWRIAPESIGTDLEPILRDWRWCGYIASWDQSQDDSTSRTTVECIGALQILNNILAVPFVTSNPYPVETVINMLVARAVSVGLLPTGMVTTHKSNDCATMGTYPAGSVLAPVGVRPGSKWSGVSTRSVGSLSSKAGEFIKSTLLPMLYTPAGRQYTLVNDHWVPRLKVRADMSVSDALRIDLATPGVTFGFSQDYSTAPNSLYTTGKDLDGTPYNSLGRSTPANYKVPSGNKSALSNRLSFNNAAPFASLPSVLNADTMLNEGSLTISDGMTLSDALEVSRKKLLQNADPGYSGTLVLSSDPSTASGTTYPRYCIQPGMSIEVSGIANNAVLFHIANVSVNTEDGKVTLTIDSKQRDIDTVEEMRARTRDPLDTIRSVNVRNRGENFPPDILLPWQPGKSGIVPYSSGKSTEIFAEVNDVGSSFPWTDVTIKYPPRKYENAYAKITKANYIDNSKNYFLGTVLLASYSDIRMLQMAAYDIDGNVLPVEFHASFYSRVDIDENVMPRVFQDSGKVGSKSVTVSPWRQRATHTQSPVRVYGFRQWQQITKSKKTAQWFSYLIVDSSTPKLPYEATLFIENVNAEVNSTSNGTARAVNKVFEVPTEFERKNKDGKFTESINNYKDRIGIPSGFNMANKEIVWLAPGTTAAQDFSLGSTAKFTIVTAATSGSVGSKVYTRYTQTKGWPEYTPYPFFELAWTDRYPDGGYIDTVVGNGLNTQFTLPNSVAGFLNGWGTYHNPAGYWPATQVLPSTPKTGLLQDESTWSVDLSKATVKWETRNPGKIPVTGNLPGHAKVIIYCESPAQDVYFLGRLLNKPQGT